MRKAGSLGLTEVPDREAAPRLEGTRIPDIAGTFLTDVVVSAWQYRPIPFDGHAVPWLSAYPVGHNAGLPFFRLSVWNDPDLVTPGRPKIAR